MFKTHKKQRFFSKFAVLDKVSEHIQIFGVKFLEQYLDLGFY